MTNKFQEAEQLLGFNNTQMASALNIPYRTYYKWVTGEQKAPAAGLSALSLLIFIHKNGLLEKFLATQPDE